MVPKGAVDVVGLEDCRQCFEHVSIPVQCLAPDGTVLQANQALLDLLGYKPADFVGLHVSEVHADPEVVADILTALANRDTLTDYATRLRCGDGSIREVQISLNAYSKGDQFVHTHSFVRDATHEHQAEREATTSAARFARTIQHLPDAMAITTLDDGCFLAVNEAYLRMIGRQGQDIVGKTSPGIGLWPRPEDRETFMQPVVRDGRVRDIEATLRCGGELRDCLVSAELTEFDGERCIVSVTKDITERKRAEAALRESEAELRQAQKMEVVGRLAGGVAHDFNNLLSIVLGRCHMLMKGLPREDPVHAGLAAISRAADRATTLTQQLLAFSRRDIVRPRVVNLNDAVTQVEQLLPLFHTQPVDDRVAHYVGRTGAAFRVIGTAVADPHLEAAFLVGQPDTGTALRRALALVDLHEPVDPGSPVQDLLCPRRAVGVPAEPEEPARRGVRIVRNRENSARLPARRLEPFVQSSAVPSKALNTVSGTSAVRKMTFRCTLAKGVRM